MNAFSRRFLIWIIPCMILCGCAVRNTDQSTKERNRIEKITIFSDIPTRNYQVITAIKATKYIDDFTNFESAEMAALESFKHQALKVGADGIIDVYLEIFEDNEVVSSAAWKEKSKIDLTRIESAVGGGCGLSASVGFKGQAIRFIP